MKKMHNVRSEMLPNLGYSLATVPDDLMRELLTQAKNKETLKPHIAGLSHAGGVTKNYKLNDTKHLDKFVLEVFKEFNNDWQYLTSNCILKTNVYSSSVNQYNTHNDVTTGNSWINFQERGEHTPSHTHDGIASYALWLDIPYSLSDEPRGSGVFEFTYNSSLGYLQTHILPVDKNWNGMMAIFPSSLTHAVQPFFSTDKPRISISGNLYIDSIGTTQ